MEERELLRRARAIWEGEPRLIRLPPAERVVFVGDTHGDLQATQTVVGRFFREGTVLVFLGDYVDRGPHSRENLCFLLRLKVAHPERVYLLMGNHEGYGVRPFWPADFWMELEAEEQELLGDALSRLPLAAWAPGGLLALHGAPPWLERLEDFEEVRPGDEQWERIVWGDLRDRPGRELGEMGGRPQLGREYFERAMERLGMRVLVRSHQPDAPTYMFDHRCLTIFTSWAYVPTRTVALWEPGGGLLDARDLQLEVV